MQLVLVQKEIESQGGTRPHRASETSRNFWFVDVASGTHQEAEMLGLGRMHHPEAD